MKHVTRGELDEAAEAVGMWIQHDCGGFRVVKDNRDGGHSYIFPNGGVCPTATKKECLIFLKGVATGWNDAKTTQTE